MKNTNILSIDIGTKNFAFWIDSFPSELLEQRIKLVYNPNGTATVESKRLLENIAMAGKTILFSNENIATGEDSKVEVSTDTLCTLNDFLNSHKDTFATCEYIVVEKQMSFGKVRNTKAIRVAHHVQSYFIAMFGRFAKIISFPAYHKTQVLGAEKLKTVNTKGVVRYKAVDKPARKKWSVNIAEDVLLARRDWESIEKIGDLQKKDDVSDCLLQGIAFVALISSGFIKL